jgi:hypothetical protein
MLAELGNQSCHFPLGSALKQQLTREHITQPQPIWHWYAAVYEVSWSYLKKVETHCQMAKRVKPSFLTPQNPQQERRKTNLMVSSQSKISRHFL